MQQIYVGFNIVTQYKQKLLQTFFMHGYTIVIHTSTSTWLHVQKLQFVMFITYPLQFLHCFWQHWRPIVATTWAEMFGLPVTKPQTLQDRSKRGDSNTSSNQDCMFSLRNMWWGSSIWSVNINLKCDRDISNIKKKNVHIKKTIMHVF